MRLPVLEAFGENGKNIRKYWRYGPVIAALISLIALMGLGYGGFDYLDDKVKYGCRGTSCAAWQP